MRITCPREIRDSQEVYGMSRVGTQGEGRLAQSPGQCGLAKRETINYTTWTACLGAFTYNIAGTNK
jgi:hypothetical protein